MRKKAENNASQPDLNAKNTVDLPDLHSPSSKMSEKQALRASSVLTNGEELLGKLRALELRTIQYNTLAQKVYSEEQECVKELATHRKIVDEYLKSTAKVMKNIMRRKQQKDFAPVNSNTSANFNAKDVDSGDEFGEESLDDGPILMAKIIYPHTPTNTKAATKTPVGLHIALDNVTELSDRLKRKVAKVEMLLPKQAKLALGERAPFTIRPSTHRINYKKDVEQFKLRYTLLLLNSHTSRAYPLCKRLKNNTLVVFTPLYFDPPHISSAYHAPPKSERIISALAHSLLDYLQYRYQRDRLYVLVSLNRAERMDLVAGDGAFGAPGRDGMADAPWGRILLPVLVIGQIWQMANAITCLILFQSEILEKGRDLGKEWHVSRLASLISF
ncbi:hypothetical protein HK100_012167 [Physocladia obscura]|uniref:Uncharacterized protein n=1 Tax=Physocladia obscura TaxID=109957 RepID=A0AAD5T046_9FUNG|nr:hypothetical protein HK100_012167 [Physocladia obscura]